jgi:integrase
MRCRIEVKVKDYGKNRNYVACWKDPKTGRRKTRSTKTRVWDEAVAFATRLEDDLIEERDRPVAKAVEWDDFRWKYTQAVSQLSSKTIASVDTTCNSLERICDPKAVGDVTVEMLDDYVLALRRAGLAEETVRSYLSHLRPMLGWARKRKMIAEVPEFPETKRKKGRRAKGRAPTREEFARMLRAVRKVRPDDARQWQTYLRGLWKSGLRLGESLLLSWEEGSGWAVDLSTLYPAIKIDGEQQKSGLDETWPMPTDFSAWLLRRTPKDQRKGRVFKLDGLNGDGPLTAPRVSKIVCMIGEAAGVEVARSTRKGRPDKVKYASAHDLRRAFGTRWASLLMPVDLQRLMRHSKIETTMEYYVDMESDNVAARVDAALRAKEGNGGKCHTRVTLPADAPVASEVPSR